MSRHDPATHEVIDAQGEGIERSARIMDLLEPELRHATDVLLDSVRAAAGVRLLDLACGVGHTTAAARARGAEALGIDIAPATIEAAKRRFPDTRFTVGDMLDPPRGPWDAITCRFGAHHAHEDWVEVASGALAPGGRIAIAEFDRRDTKSRQNGMRPAPHWVRLFEKAGLEDVSVTTRILRLGTLVVREPLLTEMLHAGNVDHFQDGPAYIVSGRRA